MISRVFYVAFNKLLGYKGRGTSKGMTDDSRFRYTCTLVGCEHTLESGVWFRSQQHQSLQHGVMTILRFKKRWYYF